MGKRGIVIGGSYSGDELMDIFGDPGERFFAVGNDTDAVVLLDEGNDNYKALAVVRLDSQPQGVEVYLKEETEDG